PRVERAPARRLTRGTQRGERLHTSSVELVLHQRPRLILEFREAFWASEALGVDLVDVLRARRAGGEPAVLGDDLDAADRLAVRRGLGEHADDLLASQLAHAC